MSAVDPTQLFGGGEGWYRSNETEIGLLKQILRALKQQTTTTGPPTVAIPAFAIITISGTAGTTPISPPGTLVRAALVQNISTNPVTLGPSGVANGKGYILNAATLAGQAGDTVTIVPPPNADVVDISQIFFNQSGTGTTLSVWSF